MNFLSEINNSQRVFNVLLTIFLCFATYEMLFLCKTPLTGSFHNSGVSEKSSDE